MIITCAPVGIVCDEIVRIFGFGNLAVATAAVALSVPTGTFITAIASPAGEPTAIFGIGTRAVAVEIAGGEVTVLLLLIVGVEIAAVA